MGMVECGRGRWGGVGVVCGVVWQEGYEVAVFWCFFFQAEDGIRDLVRSRGLGDVYKRQGGHCDTAAGAKLTVVVCPSFRGRIPSIKRNVHHLSLIHI